MLSYEDCLGMSPLTREEVAVIAKHEHIPEIVALEVGASLFESSKGRELIGRMILAAAADACKHCDPNAAGKLALVLHRFLEAHTDRRGSSPPLQQTTAPANLGESAEAPSYLDRTLRHFGIDPAWARERFGAEMQVAEMCCAICPQSGRCRRFIAARADTPSAFCPNTPLLDELERSAGLHAG